MVPGGKWMALGGVVLLVGVLAASVVRPAGLWSDWDTTGEMWEKRGSDYWIDTNKPEYVGSWLPNRDSETITIQGRYQLGDWTVAQLNSYRYALYIEGSDTPLKRFPTDGTWITFGWEFTTNMQYLQSWSVEVKTEGAVKLKAVMEVKIKDYFQIYTYSDPEDLAWDGAKVISGFGDIFIPSNLPQGPFEEGGTAKVYVKTGYSGGKGWYAALHPPADRTDLDQTPDVIKTLGDNVQTIVDIPIPVGAWKEGSSNKWEAQLYNNFFPYKFTYVLSIDDEDRAPLITDVTTVNNGNSISFTVFTNRTYMEVAKVEVCAWYSYGGFGMPARTDTESWIMMDMPFPVVNDTATFTVYPKNMDGTICVYIVAYDTEMRPSAPKLTTFVVEEGKTDDIKNDPASQPWVWTFLAVACVALMVIATAAVWILGWMYKWPIYVMVILTLIIVLSLGTVALAAGFGWFGLMFMEAWIGGI